MFLNCTRSLTRTCSGAALIVAAGLLLSTVAMAEQAISHYDIPAENAAKALLDFSRQAGVQILYPYDEAAKHNVAALKGDFSQEEALAKLLAGTGLEVASRTDKTISLRLIVAPIADAQASKEEATQVVVTGTRLRNTQPISPVHTVTRADISNSGYSQIGDVIRSLPENFSGGQNPGVIAAGGNVGNTNVANASTVNLRGLGTDATLVLVNGHRIAGSSYLQGSDISGIPIAAVQRVEVVTDGASALYGSDAVAGVANFVLRKNFNGGEVSVNLGNTTRGGGREETYSALFGRARSNWFAMANFEYAKQGEITASQRSFTSNVKPDVTLIRPQVRQSLFFSAGAELRTGMSVSLDALISDRRSDGTLPYDQYTPLTKFSSYSPSYSVSAMSDLSLGRDWKVHLTATASGSRDMTGQEIPDYSYSTQASFKNDLQYLELSADGTALHLPSGDVRVALGGGHRREHFSEESPQSLAFHQDGERTVSYLYAEANIPVVSASDTRVGLQKLEVSLSARTEDYSDFGRSSNPKLGIRYVPVKGLNLRATLGTSFKAPMFNQLYQSTQIYVYDANQLGYSGAGVALVPYGGNRNLKPETSRSWTLGADYTPKGLTSMILAATYFGIHYKDRVIRPVDNLVVGLSNPIFVPFVEFSPSLSKINYVQSNAAFFYNYSSGAYDPADVVAILNDNYTNATDQTVRGIDLSYRQTFLTRLGSLQTFGNATVLRLRQQSISTVPTVTLSGTIFNVPKFKARIGASWLSGSWVATAIVNHVSSETDNGITPSAEVAAWTTADATVSYVFREGSPGLNGVSIVLAATNLFDRAPPYAQSPGLLTNGFFFDSTNYSLLGRQVRVSVTKRW